MSLLHGGDNEEQGEREAVQPSIAPEALLHLYERHEADMSYDYPAFSVKLRFGNNNIINLREGYGYDQCSTSVEQKYLLCTGTYTKGIGLIDLENEEVLLKDLRVAFWIY